MSVRNRWKGRGDLRRLEEYSGVQGAPAQVRVGAVTGGMRVLHLSFHVRHRRGTEGEREEVRQYALTLNVCESTAIGLWNNEIPWPWERAHVLDVLENVARTLPERFRPFRESLEGISGNPRRIKWIN